MSLTRLSASTHLAWLFPSASSSVVQHPQQSKKCNHHMPPKPPDRSYSCSEPCSGELAGVASPGCLLSRGVPLANRCKLASIEAPCSGQHPQSFRHVVDSSVSSSALGLGRALFQTDLQRLEPGIHVRKKLFLVALKHLKQGNLQGTLCLQHCAVFHCGALTSSTCARTLGAASSMATQCSQLKVPTSITA